MGRPPPRPMTSFWKCTAGNSVATEAELMTALRNAHAAGDSAGAQRIAGMLKAQRSAAPPLLARPADPLTAIYDEPAPAGDRWGGPKTPKIKSGAHGVVDTAMLGLGDELRGGGGALQAVMTGNDPGYAYTQVKRRAEAGREKAQADNPVSYGAGQVAGAVALPTGKINSIGRAALIGGGYGAAYGFGSGEDVDDRLRRAGAGGAGGAILGGGTQAVIGPLVRGASKRVTEATQKLEQFDRAGVRPSAAAIAPEGSMAPGATKAISENWLAGGRARNALLGSIDDTRQAAARIAEDYGDVAPTEVVGQNVRTGVADWAQSFKRRAEDIYQKASGPLIDAPAEPLVTRFTIGDIVARVTPGTASADIIIPRQMNKIAEALSGDTGRLTFGDLRAWRTWVREAQKEPALSQGIDAASLQRLEMALTDDIYRAAEKIGGPAALRKLQQADEFYRLGQERIKRVLAPFADPRGTPQTAYQRIIGLASAGGRQNTEALLALKRSLPAEQWRDVAASIISHLGDVKPGSPAALTPGAFSVENFVTNYAKMTPEGRAVLFGSRGGGNGPATALSAELDNLAQVAGMQKRVEGMANTSRSGVSLQNMATVGSLATPAMPFTVLGLMGAAAAGEALTNPGFVRWLATQGNVSAVSAQSVRQLGLLASRDPALQPVYQALAEQAGASSGGRSRAPEAPQQQAGQRLQ